MELRQEIAALPDDCVVEETDWAQDTELGDMRWWSSIGNQVSFRVSTSIDPFCRPS